MARVPDIASDSTMVEMTSKLKIEMLKVDVL